MRIVGWVVGIGAVALIGLYFLALNTGKSLEERDDLAAQLARLGGNPTCNIAWIKASESGRAGDRTPDGYAPEVKVIGPPRVVACGMLKTGGVKAEPLLIYERCRDIDRRCIDFVD